MLEYVHSLTIKMAKSAASRGAGAAPTAPAPSALYVIGGHTGGSEGHQLDTISVYNPGTGMWTQPVPPLPRRSHDHAAAMVDGVLFVVGGRTETGGELDSGYKLSVEAVPPLCGCEEGPAKVHCGICNLAFCDDCDADGHARGAKKAHIRIPIEEHNQHNQWQWEEIPKMREPRFGHCCVSLGGMLYTLGGWHEEKLQSCERFNPAGQSWHAIAAMNRSKCGAAAIVLGGKIYVMGGWSVEPAEAERIEDMKRMEVYDPQTDEWTDGPMMNRGREGMSSCVHEGKIYMVGGVDSNEEPLQSIEVFDPATQVWSMLQVQLPDEHGRGLGGCASIEGKIYIAGGFVGDKVAASGWEFDPATGSFVPIANMPSATERFATVMAANVVQPGGGGGGGGSGAVSGGGQGAAPSAPSLRSGGGSAAATIRDGSTKNKKKIRVNNELGAINDGGEDGDGDNPPPLTGLTIEAILNEDMDKGKGKGKGKK